MSQRVSYVEAAREAAAYVDAESVVLERVGNARTSLSFARNAAALRELARLVEKITEAVATDERARTLTDPSARSSEQQYAEEEIISAAVSVAAGFDPEGMP